MNKAIQPPKQSDSEAFPYGWADFSLKFLNSTSTKWWENLEIYAINPNFIMNLDTLKGLKDILVCGGPTYSETFCRTEKYTTQYSLNNIHSTAFIWYSDEHY